MQSENNSTILRVAGQNDTNFNCSGSFTLLASANVAGGGQANCSYDDDAAMLVWCLLSICDSAEGIQRRFWERIAESIVRLFPNIITLAAFAWPLRRL